VIDKVIYKPIGIVHSPFAEPAGTPIQSVSAMNEEGWIEVFEEYEKGLADLDGFSHIFVIYHCHLVRSVPLLVKPYMDDTERGVFATRSPARPNPIGLSVVGLEAVEGNVLRIRGIDMIDGTPVLDIKPFVPEFQVSGKVRIGWLEKRVKRLDVTRDDGRFKRED